MWEVPVGFVRTADDRLERIADRQCQQAMAGGFRTFRATAQCAANDALVSC